MFLFSPHFQQNRAVIYICRCCPVHGLVLPTTLPASSDRRRRAKSSPKRSCLSAWPFLCPSSHPSIRPPDHHSISIGYSASGVIWSKLLNSSKRPFPYPNIAGAIHLGYRET